MKASMKNKRGVVGAVVLAGILSVGGYALTNTINFAAKTVAGYGEQAVEPVMVTSTGWALNQTNPTLLESVTFGFDSITFGAGGAEAWFKAGKDTGTWVKCTDIAAGAQTSVVCPTTAEVATIGAVTPFVAPAAGTNTVTTPTEENIQLVVAEKVAP